MSLEKKLKKALVVAAITVAAVFAPKSSEAQGPFISPMQGPGIRAGIRPGYECQFQYGNHPYPGHPTNTPHFNIRCYAGGKDPFFNQHINARAAGAAGMIGNVTAGHFSQIGLASQYCNKAAQYQQMQNRCGSMARPGLPVICPNYSSQIRENQNMCIRYYNQAAWMGTR